MQEKARSRTRILYIIEAALEYFIAILMEGSYLATLTSNLGISDSMTGIISAVISLGCLFQLFSTFLNRRRRKTIVTILSVVNQLLFMFLYIIPLSGGEKPVKAVIFILVLITAYIILNTVRPLKMDWMMSLVDEKKRGIFTSWKEIVSLLSGMLFSFGMGTLIDYFSDRGEVKTAFLLCGITIFALMVLHTLTLVFSVEPDRGEAAPTEKNPIQAMLSALKDKNVRKISLLLLIWQTAFYAAIPFYGTYLIKELGFNLQFVSILSIIYSLARASISTFWGKFADKNSFASMISVCLFIAGCGFVVNIFTVPENGAIFYTLYNVLYAIAMAGINSAMTNLVFERVEPSKCSNALAISQSVGGVAGFGMTILMSALVSHIQASGDTLFGIPIYAQQVTSLIAAVLTFVAVFYVITAFRKKKTN